MYSVMVHYSGAESNNDQQLHKFDNLLNIDNP